MALSVLSLPALCQQDQQEAIIRDGSLRHIRRLLLKKEAGEAASFLDQELAKQPQAADAYFALLLYYRGVVYQETGRFAEAEKSLDRAAFLQQQLLWKGHPDLADTYFRLGKVLANLGRKKEASRYLMKHLETVEELMGSDSPAVTDKLREIANHLHEIGATDAALPLYRRYIKDAYEYFPQDHWKLFKAWFTIGRMCFIIKRYEEAEHAYKKALALPGPFDPDDQPLVLNLKASMLQELAAIARGRGDQQQRTYYLQELRKLNRPRSSAEYQTERVRPPTRNSRTPAFGNATFK